MKINHTLDATTQNFRSFRAYLFLSDGTLNIINRKPCLGRVAADEARVTLADVKAMGAGRSLIESEDGDVYKLSKSSSTTAVADITGIVYGGTTSRFWIFRKHFSCLSFAQLQNLPFHSWDCLTL